MKSRAAVTISLAFLFYAIRGWSEPADFILNQMQGTWVVAGCEKEGEVFTKEAVKNFTVKVVIKGDKMVSLKDGEVLKMATIKIDITGTPWKLDTTDEKGTTEIGLFSFEGDQLWICSAMASGIERPAGFETKPGSKHILVKFKREKP